MFAGLCFTDFYHRPSGLSTPRGARRSHGAEPLCMSEGPKLNVIEHQAVLKTHRRAMRALKFWRSDK